MALIVGCSLLAVVYVWRFVEAAYLQPPPAAAPSGGEAPLSMLLPAWTLVGACVYFGLETSFTVGFAADAAALLLRSAP